MCNANGILFAALNLKKEDIQGKKVIEVGSMDVNGSVRPLLESYGPKQYVGVDITKGPSVDIVCDAERLLVDVFERNSFDVTISTEMVEHARNWRKIISNLKAITAPGGIIYISTRSRGFPYHAYPYDFWRYEIQDIKNIFSDCLIEKVEKDPDRGVFAKIRKPVDFVENDLSSYKLYSIVADKQVVTLEEAELSNFLREKERRRRLKNLIRRFNFLNWVSPQ